MTEVRVGTTTLTYYPHLRNFVGLPFNEVSFVKIPNLLGFMAGRIEQINLGARVRPYVSMFQNVVVDVHLHQCHLVHLFNGIPVTDKPWIATFETCIPRWALYSDIRVEYFLKCICDDRCKRIISLSENAHIRQLELLGKYSAYRKSVQEKLEIMHPPQKQAIMRYQEKQLDIDNIVFTFVGHDFFRKGGNEILFIFDHLINKKYPVKLNIVSSLNCSDYASKASSDDVLRAMQIISKHSDNIIHYYHLSNRQVVNLLINSHVGLLPTYDDSYGYAVLEAQAAGCPVITTDIRVLPEINNNDIGWLIEVPKDRLNVGLFKSDAERHRFSKVVREGLEFIVTSIVENSEMIRRKGQRCIKRIERFHNPYVNARRLERLYQEIVSQRL